MRLKLAIAYDGAPFAGWQSQSRGNTIQDTIEQALALIANAPVALHGSGRTDAGVHALGQIAHFDPPAGLRLQPAEWQRALNANLPPAIRILRVARAAEDFHARFSATGKIYRYRLWNAPVLPPHEYGRAWHVPYELDLGVTNDVLGLFHGRHDFRSFAANRGKAVSDTVREIRDITLARHGRAIAITFTGSGFLYKMVRMLAGSAVRAGLGRAEFSHVRELLERPGERKWTHVAPAGGLYLVKVFY